MFHTHIAGLILNPVEKSFPFSDEKNWGSEGLSDFAKVLKLGCSSGDLNPSWPKEKAICSIALYKEELFWHFMIIRCLALKII